MTKLLSTFIICLLTISTATAQTDSAEMWFVGADIYTAAGENFTNGVLGIKNQKIIYVGTKTNAPIKGQTIDVSGKRIYPGLIALNSNLGLTEIEAVRATNDFAEVGENNAHIRTATTFNTDSKVMKTVLANGILLAQVCPQGGLISGQSSVMKLQARNWEEAIYTADNVIHIHWPNFDGDEKQDKVAAEQSAQIVSWLQQAKVYGTQKSAATNLRYKALSGIFVGGKKVFVHANGAQTMVNAIQNLQALGIQPTIVGGKESASIAPFLKQNNIGIIISRTHSLPNTKDDSYQAPYALPYKLFADSVPFAISEINFWEQRNLPFEAGQAVAFGLPYDEALKAITIYPAQFLGIDKTTGSLATGKHATFIITTGDVLDMRTSIVEQAYISGKPVDLTNPQEELYKKFKKVVLEGE